ncbi:uncharacterized protein LOC143912390 [Arctopsyche grandis]|uniref:uncharacterized protein LOC143912390 n=1 Tax=Arctopsyche grandis TaxID=121162 RepID=UPI00406D8240
MIRILQINLNGCQAAQDVMIQTAEERRADLVIVSEQYRNIPHRWYSDASSRSAIYTPTAHLRITNAVSIGVQGWTWVEMRGVRFYSCYFSPSATIEEFKRDLVCLEDDVRTSTLPVVVAGDFNSKAPEWGSQKTDRRGILLSEMASHLHLHAANVGSAYTFVRGSTGSVIDVTFAGETIIGRIRKWQVLDSYSHSDHRYIGFELEDRLAGPQMLPSSSGWGARKLDIVALDEAVAELRSKCNQVPIEKSTTTVNVVSEGLDSFYILHKSTSTIVIYSWNWRQETDLGFISSAQYRWLRKTYRYQQQLRC